MASKPNKAPAKPGQRPSQGPSNMRTQPQRQAPPQEERRNVPATRQTTAVAGVQAGTSPAYLKNKEMTGRGISTKAEDNLVPIITVLQKNSPQCEKRDPKYMEDAEAGVIWMRGAEYPLVSGEEGFLFQPCFFDHDWVEWIPRGKGGGLVGRHKERPAEAKQIEVLEEGKPRKKWVLKNGNEVVETRYHGGRVFLENGDRFAYMIPLQSSGHTVSKGWTFDMNSKKDASGQKPDSFALIYRVRTKYRQNAQGNWFVLDPVFEGWVANEEDYEAGLALHQAFATGEKEMDTRQFAEEGEESGAGEGGDDRNM